MVLVPNIRILDFLIHDIGPTLLTLFRCSMSRTGAGSQICERVCTLPEMPGRSHCNTAPRPSSALDLNAAPSRAPGRRDFGW
jgi:hypothetical protein